tara:strand:+ start:576 stop:959 length:384 start_codon:yes stop_codon:yes gene_type:complete
MPHQCVRCSKFYDDGDSVILTGCNCGAKLFFYVKKEKVQKAKKVTEKLTHEEVEKIEVDVKEIIGKQEKEEPIVLDFESVNISAPGKFELDLVKLFNKENALVYRLEDGKYMIDVATTMDNFRRNKK